MYSEKKARELVIKAGKELVEKGLVARTWGNVSARISETEFVITPSGRDYESLKPKDLVKVKIKDASYEGDIKPSSEKGVHAAAYALRETANFVIHTHQYYASCVSADEQDMPFAPCAKYGLPGSKNLKKNLIKSIEQNSDAKKFLMAKHGALIIGDSYEEAFKLSSKLESECKKQVMSRLPNMERQKNAKIDVESLVTKDNPSVIIVQDKFINECCQAGVAVKPYIDDFAQIVGPEASVVENRKLDMKAGLLGRNAVLVKGTGAVCIGANDADAEAVAMIVSKNCAAACYARKAGPIGKIDSRMQRYVYLKKYSKLKDSKE